MSSRNDFVAFYQQLGLPANCSVADLKNAYRRRVAELHPDRHPQRAADAEAAERLTELTATYTAALAFERRHGRLPGAAPVRGRAASVPPARPAPPAAAPRAHAAPASRRTGLRRVLAAAALAAAAAWLVFGREAPDAAPSPAGAADTPWTPAAVRAPPVFGEAPAARADAAPPSQLELGMSAEHVQRLEGRPLMMTPERWDYGPSWIAFSQGRVSDWYSSKLRPLRTAAARPAEANR